MTPPEVTDLSTEAPEAAEAVQPETAQAQPPVEPSAVQPADADPGQQDAQGDGFYDLSTITDPAVRSEVERIAKERDRNVSAKLQEAADYRKRWEAFEELGVDEYGAESIGVLLDFANRLADPDTAAEAVQTLAANVGVDFGATEEEGDDDPVTALQSEIAELRAWRDSREENEQLAVLQAQETQRLQAEYAEVEKLNGKAFSEKEKDRLIQLAQRFQGDSDEPIKAAFTFLRDVTGSAETALVDAQPATPAPAEPAGRASTVVPPVESFEDAERIMRERRATVQHA